MITNDPAEDSRFHPQIILVGVGWVAATWVSLYFLPKSIIQTMLLLTSPIIAAFLVACIPPSVLKRTLVRFTKSWLTCCYLYAFVVVGVAVILLLGCSAAGYLPYSDRPGPGWGNIPPHFPQLQEIGYFAGWAALSMLPVCVLSGSVFFFLAVWCGWFGAPAWVMRLTSAILCGVLTLFLTDAAGWIIAIAPFPVWGTGVAGAVFGAGVLPRFVSPLGSSISKWLRVILVGLAHLAVAARISFLFGDGVSSCGNSSVTFTSSARHPHRSFGGEKASA